MNNITLQPSKAVLTQAAAQIYAAYMISGRVPEGSEEEWMERAIRDSIAMAHAIDASVHSDSELPVDGSEHLKIPVPTT